METAQKAETTADKPAPDPVAAALAALKAEAETKKAVAEAAVATAGALVPGIDSLPTNSLDSSKAGTSFALKQCYAALDSCAVQVIDAIKGEIGSATVWINASTTGPSPIETAGAVQATLDLVSDSVRESLTELRLATEHEEPESPPADSESTEPKSDGANDDDVDPAPARAAMAMGGTLAAAAITAGLPLLASAFSSTSTLTGASADLPADAVLNAVLGAALKKNIPLLLPTAHVAVDETHLKTIKAIESNMAEISKQMRLLGNRSRETTTSSASLLAEKKLRGELFAVRITGVTGETPDLVQTEINELLALEAKIAEQSSIKAEADELVMAAQTVLTKAEAALTTLRTIGADGFSPLTRATVGKALLTKPNEKDAQSPSWVRLEVSAAAAGHETTHIDRKWKADSATDVGMTVLTYRLTDERGKVVAAGNISRDVTASRAFPEPS